MKAQIINIATLQVSSSCESEKVGVLVIWDVAGDFCDRLDEGYPWPDVLVNGS